MTDEIHFTYKNYRGEIGRRRVRARDIHVSFGATHYHPEPQIIFRAFDLDKEAVREFAMKDMDFRDELTVAEDQWFDPDTEVTWVRPTAHAYAMTCKARDKWHEEAKNWDMNVESLLSEQDADIVRVCEGGGPEDLKMSLVVSFMKTREMRDKALRHVGELVIQVGRMRDSAKALFIDHWKRNGLHDYVMRAQARNGGDKVRTYVGSHQDATVGDVSEFIKAHEEVLADGPNTDKT